MKLEDLTYINCRELQYEADSHKEKSTLYGTTALMLELNSPTMSGMNCLVAYIITGDKKEKFTDSAWDMCSTLEEVNKSYHICYEHKSEEHLKAYLEQGHKVVILEEERAYLRPTSCRGADALMKVEQDRLVKAIANPRDTDHYHFDYLPACYESFGRVAMNHKLFMSGLAG